MYVEQVRFSYLCLHLSSCHSTGTIAGTLSLVDCHTSDPVAAASTSRHSSGTLLPEESRRGKKEEREREKKKERQKEETMKREKLRQEKRGKTKKGEENNNYTCKHPQNLVSIHCVNTK